MEKFDSILSVSQIFQVMRESSKKRRKILSQGIGCNIPGKVCITYDEKEHKYLVFDNKGEYVVSYGSYENPIEAFCTFADVILCDYDCAKMLKDFLVENISICESDYLYYFQGCDLL